MQKPANKPIIAVDIDDVVYPFVPSLIKYLDVNHKVRMSQHDFIEYDIRKVWGGGPVEATKIFKNYIKDSGIHIAPIKDAQKALHVLSDRYKIIVMTSRDISSFPKTHEWITHHFPDIFKDVHLLGNKQDSVTFRGKAEVCKELGVYCLIDDHLSHVIGANEVGIKTILFGDYPWNQTADLPPEIIRVKNWQEVLEHFE
jgi:5'(3')-deoxyribonucleotidase